MLTLCWLLTSGDAGAQLLMPFVAPKRIVVLLSPQTAADTQTSPENAEPMLAAGWRQQDLYGSSLYSGSYAPINRLTLRI